jgi:hypothetical protein
VGHVLQIKWIQPCCMGLRNAVQLLELSIRQLTHCRLLAGMDMLPHLRFKLQKLAAGCG